MLVPLLPTGCDLNIRQRVPIVRSDVSPGIRHFLEWPFRPYPLANGRFELRLQPRVGALFCNPEPDDRIEAFLGTRIDVDDSHYKFLDVDEEAVCTCRV